MCRPSRRSPRCRSPSARNSRHRPALSSWGQNGWTATIPVSNPFFSAFSTPLPSCRPVRHSAMNAVSSRRRLRKWCCQRMLRRDRHETRTKDRVVACREDLQRLLLSTAACALQRPIDQHAFGSPDPVRLHRAHFCRPSSSASSDVQQIVGILGDLEEPLRQLALLDQRAGSPARARRSPVRWPAPYDRPGPS